MKFYSTTDPSHSASLSEAVMRGLAPNRGLYMPMTIPQLPSVFFKSLSQQSLPEMSYQVAKAFVEDDVPPQELERIVRHTLSFEIPLRPVDGPIMALELFHGPTLAFKDVGARFMSQLLGYFAQCEQREAVVLAATSGDTGSAVANGFLGTPHTRVVILYPSDKVSEAQEKQFTTLGQNITAIEVRGTFDDCQRLVKEAFADAELTRKHFLTSANSINIARLIPQMFYYFYAWSRVPVALQSEVAVSVPSGNFGNLTAGLMAQKMGLPIAQFIAATNVNDMVPLYLATKQFSPRPSLSTISNAMDVGNPSNFDRILALFGGQHDEIRKHLLGYAFTDEETAQAMRDLHARVGYTMDPHGAVGYLGLKKYDKPYRAGIFLETAHPAKFADTVEQILKNKITIPDRLQAFMDKPKQSISSTREYLSFKEILKSILNK